MKRTRPKPRSQKKQEMHRLYDAEIEKRGGIPKGYEPHHPITRLGDRMLCFCIIRRETHAWIHANGREARKLGWMGDGLHDRLPVNAPVAVEHALKRWTELTGKTYDRICA